ncbi:2Fe-2S iron-sulfur cluster-binding protein [Algiphilus sp.]|uniref:2Fe-2S iron-sulfur cluster-binding protein n=1 Tax=Algiphilus sp. TaxID=1872431 RepID=UPI0025B998FF|nr:2Fe-2S iron-sulfur cluster-binding protein [Algiphilus sp.]MCK5769517.1 2Fe-2S iron-sulfur cluster binding domain-containing protein [Algiphilus sp.]
MQIKVTDHSGVEHDIDAPVGGKIMEAIRQAGLPVAAQCGGCCSCATCHVYVHEAWLGQLPPPEEEEAEMLELAEDCRDASRLSCQLTAVEALDGIRVTLAPGSQL